MSSQCCHKRLYKLHKHTNTDALDSAQISELWKTIREIVNDHDPKNGRLYWLHEFAKKIGQHMGPLDLDMYGSSHFYSSFLIDCRLPWLGNEYPLENRTASMLYAMFIIEHPDLGQLRTRFPDWPLRLYHALERRDALEFDAKLARLSYSLYGPELDWAGWESLLCLALRTNSVDLLDRLLRKHGGEAIHNALDSPEFGMMSSELFDAIESPEAFYWLANILKPNHPYKFAITMYCSDDEDETDEEEADSDEGDSDARDPDAEKRVIKRIDKLADWIKLEEIPKDLRKQACDMLAELDQSRVNVVDERDKVFARLVELGQLALVDGQMHRLYPMLYYLCRQPEITQVNALHRYFENSMICGYKRTACYYCFMYLQDIDLSRAVVHHVVRDFGAKLLAIALHFRNYRMVRELLL